MTACRTTLTTAAAQADTQPSSVGRQMSADSHGSLSTAADLRLTTNRRPRRQHHHRLSLRHMQPGGIANVNHSDTTDQHAQISSQRTFHCLLFNSRSLLNKLPELHNILYSSNNIDCICITESWLHGEIPDSLLDPKSMYTVMRCDRVGIRGGGVCLFVKRHFHVLRNDLTPTPAGVELLCFDLLGFDATYRFFHSIPSSSQSQHKQKWR